MDSVHCVRICECLRTRAVFFSLFLTTLWAAVSLSLSLWILFSFFSLLCICTRSVAHLLVYNSHFGFGFSSKSMLAELSNAILLHVAISNQITQNNSWAHCTLACSIQCFHVDSVSLSVIVSVAARYGLVSVSHFIIIFYFAITQASFRIYFMSTTRFATMICSNFSWLFERDSALIYDFCYYYFFFFSVNHCHWSSNRIIFSQSFSVQFAVVTIDVLVAYFVTVIDRKNRQTSIIFVIFVEKWCVRGARFFFLFFFSFIRLLFSSTGIRHLSLWFRHFQRAIF